MSDPNLELRGYPEFQKAIKDIDRLFPKTMAETAVNIARDWVSLAQAAAGEPQQALAARDLSAQADELGATITNDSPLFFGAEFGGQGRPETMQFPPYQGKRGYWLYPTARENADRFNAQWEDAVDVAMKPWDHKER
jgi:hypothetical protein